MKETQMLDGFTPWKPDARAKLIEEGWWENRCIADMVAATAARHPDKIALIEEPRQLTYAQLCGQVDTLACALLQQGIKTQNRVVMQLPNCLEFIVLYLALTRINAIPVMALHNHRHSEVRHFISASGAVAYVIAERYRKFDYRPMAAQMMHECESLQTVLVPYVGTVAVTVPVALIALLTKPRC